MIGYINKIVAAPGRREALISLLLEGSGGMPGCLSYVVAADAGEPETVWVTEIWDSPESHDASLALPAVKAAIEAAMPIIADFANVATTRPVQHSAPAG